MIHFAIIIFTRSTAVCVTLSKEASFNKTLLKLGVGKNK